MRSARVGLGRMGMNRAGGCCGGSKKIHVSERPGPPDPGIPPAAADHYLTWEAGTGIT